MELKQHCGTNERRQKVLESQKLIGPLKLNGIDYLEVLDQDAPSDAMRQRLINIAFLKTDGITDAQHHSLMTPANFVIEGGTRIRGIKVTNVAAGPDDQTLQLTVNRPGDFSRYVLRVRGSASVAEPPANFDPVLASVEFTFKADCPTDFDCVAPGPANDPVPPAPPIDYLAKDYESFRRLMLDRMAVTLPAWAERSPADLGVTLVETLAYGADMASYYQDAAATEGYLSRARLRASVRRHARFLGYQVDEGTNARVFVAIDAKQNAAQTNPPLLPRGTIILTYPSKPGAELPPAARPGPTVVRDAVRDGARVFETMEDLTALRVKRNDLRFHTWSGSNCCLPAGTTVAHLVGTIAQTGLARGDVLIFEEVVPLGGTADDPPDLSHRQAVRLSEPPKAMIDLLDDTSVIEVRWHQADALRFPLNLQGQGGKPGARARGNVVLADHGRTRDYVFANTATSQAVANSLHADLRNKTGLWPAEAPAQRAYRPLLVDGPVTRAADYDPMSFRARPACEALLQDAGSARPQVTLADDGGATWLPQPDLLLSNRFADEFTVEARNDGKAELRFGDGRYGKRPASKTSFLTRLRVGTGTDGRIGAGALVCVITSDPNIIAGVTNPLPASGGSEGESLTAVKLSAPRAFRKQKRAVTADDYATFLQTHPQVQRAVADRRWTGSWYTIFISVDRVGSEDFTPAFEQELRDFLEPVRLAGHDLEIDPPEYVPLDIAMVVCVARGYYAGEVEAALADRFGAGLQRDGTPGFFNPDNQSFGEPVRLSRIIAAAMAVPGVRWAGLSLPGFSQQGRFGRLDDQSVDFSGSGLLPIGRREVARLDNDPNAPERGRLRFFMEGGQ